MPFLVHNILGISFYTGFISRYVNLLLMFIIRLIPKFTYVYPKHVGTFLLKTTYWVAYETNVAGIL